MLNEQSKFPGWWALLPTLGAFFLIGAGPKAWFNKNVLSLRPMVAIGLISYPLYLWHWPLLSFGKILYGDNFTLLYRIVIALVSILLAYLTYQLIEKPLKSFDLKTKKEIAASLVSSALVIGLVGIVVFKQAINPYSIKFPIGKISAALNDWEYPGKLKWKYDENKLLYHELGEGKQAVLFMGDSNMEQYSPRMEVLMANEEVLKNNRVIFVALGGCPPIRTIFNGRSDNKNCPGLVELGLKIGVGSDVQTVVLGADWTAYFKKESLYVFNDQHSTKEDEPGYQLALNDLGQVIQKFRQAGKKVYLMMNIPRGPEFDPKFMVERSFSFDPISIKMPQFSRKDFIQKFEKIFSDVSIVGVKSGAILINPMDFLCKENDCPIITNDGSPIYKDENHMRPFYIRENVKYLDFLIK